ncbi:MAG: hypothetical protein AB1567_00365 [bacterium]
MRIKPKYKEFVRIPEDFKKYLWEYEDKATLETIILRVLIYGNFEELNTIYQLYPDKTYEITLRYPEIKRGVKFWIKKWHKDEGTV